VLAVVIAVGLVMVAAALLTWRRYAAVPADGERLMQKGAVASPPVDKPSDTPAVEMAHGAPANPAFGEPTPRS